MKAVTGSMRNGKVKRIQFSGMVGVKDVAEILFGIESNGGLAIVDANGKKMYAEVARRLIPCI